MYKIFKKIYKNANGVMLKCKKAQEYKEKRFKVGEGAFWTDIQETVNLFFFRKKIKKKKRKMYTFLQEMIMLMMIRGYIVVFLCAPFFNHQIISVYTYVLLGQFISSWIFFDSF